MEKGSSLGSWKGFLLYCMGYVGLILDQTVSTARLHCCRANTRCWGSFTQTSGRTLKEVCTFLHTVHGTRSGWRLALDCCQEGFVCGSVWWVFFRAAVENEGGFVAGCREELNCVRGGSDWWGSRTQEEPCRGCGWGLGELFLYNYFGSMQQKGLS